MAGHCLELTRLLVNSGQPFKINIKVGSFLNYFASSGKPEGPTKQKKNIVYTYGGEWGRSTSGQTTLPSMGPDHPMYLYLYSNPLINKYID